MRKLRARLLLALTFITVPALPFFQDAAQAQQSAQAGKPNAKVWVNTHSGVYHCPGTRWYGATKQGEYMTQKEAEDKGFRADHGRPCDSGETEAQTAATTTQQPESQTQPKSGAARAPGGGTPDAKVWVNTSTGVYHCPGTRWYGNTKSGKYTTQKEAQADGDRPAYGKPCQ